MRDSVDLKGKKIKVSRLLRHHLCSGELVRAWKAGLFVLIPPPLPTPRLIKRETITDL